MDVAISLVVLDYHHIHLARGLALSHGSAGSGASYWCCHEKTWPATSRPARWRPKEEILQESPEPCKQNGMHILQGTIDICPEAPPRRSSSTWSSISSTATQTTIHCYMEWGRAELWSHHALDPGYRCGHSSVHRNQMLLGLPLVRSWQILDPCRRPSCRHSHCHQSDYLPPWSPSIWCASPRPTTTCSTPSQTDVHRRAWRLSICMEPWTWTSHQCLSAGRSVGSFERNHRKTSQPKPTCAMWGLQHRSSTMWRIGRTLNPSDSLELRRSASTSQGPIQVPGHD